MMDDLFLSPYPSRRLGTAGLGDHCLRLFDCEGELLCCRDRQICAPHCDLKQEGDVCSPLDICDHGQNCCNGKCIKTEHGKCT